MKNQFTAVYEKRGEWYIGYTEELTGANVQERTLEETKESLREAVSLILEANRELSRRVPLTGKYIREELTIETV